MHREAIFIEHARTGRAYGEIKNCLHSSAIAWRLSGDSPEALRLALPRINWQTGCHREHGPEAVDQGIQTRARRRPVPVVLPTPPAAASAS
jgi:hypothetical protein